MKKLALVFLATTAMLLLPISVGSAGAQEDNLRLTNISFDRHEDYVDIIAETSIEIGDDTTHSVPLVTQTKINGEIVDTISETVTIAAGGGCYFTSPPCAGKDCPDLGVGPFQFHGTCEDRYVPGVGSMCFCVYIRLWSSAYYNLDSGSVVTVILDPYNDVQEFDETDNEIGVVYGIVGGIVVPIDKFALLAPYIALASTILVAAAIYFRRVRHRKEEQ